MRLTAFLLARISEDEATARKYPELGGDADPWELRVDFDRDYCEPSGIVIDPSRVIRECEAKRAIIKDAEWLLSGSDIDAREVTDWLFGCLALPYADHPDYHEDWKP